MITIRTVRIPVGFGRSLLYGQAEVPGGQKVKIKGMLTALLLAAMLGSLAGCGGRGTQAVQEPEIQEIQEVQEPEDQETGASLGLTDPEEEPIPVQEAVIEEDGTYTTRDDVALYLYTYDHLPDNFITKKEARALGWEGGSLEPYAPGKCIGGDRFGNREGALPDGSYHECDIDTLGAKSRGSKRLVYSDDGRIYYTGDHYETFDLLYGEENGE